MTSQEKDQLLALLLDVRHWCQAAEARRADGQPVSYSDPEATAWDLTGAVCHLFGWRRACELFIQIDRRLHPRPRAALAGDAAITAMVGLQSWNDDPQRSHPELLAVLGQLPISNRAGGGEEPVVAAPDGYLGSPSDGVPHRAPDGLPGAVPDGSGA